MDFFEALFLATKTGGKSPPKNPRAKFKCRIWEFCLAKIHTARDLALTNRAPLYVFFVYRFLLLPSNVTCVRKPCSHNAHLQEQDDTPDLHNYRVNLGYEMVMKCTSLKDAWKPKHNNTLKSDCHNSSCVLEQVELSVTDCKLTSKSN